MADRRPLLQRGCSTLSESGTHVLPGLPLSRTLRQTMPHLGNLLLECATSDLSPVHSPLRAGRGVKTFLYDVAGQDDRYDFDYERFGGKALMGNGKGLWKRMGYDSSDDEDLEGCAVREAPETAVGGLLILHFPFYCISLFLPGLV